MRLTRYIIIVLLLVTSCSVKGLGESQQKTYALALWDESGKVLLIGLADDSKVVDLTAVLSGPLEYGLLSWSPDGRQVVFVSNRDGNREIYSIDLETRTLVNITKNPAADVTPSWSPDGRYIAFISDRDYCSVDRILPDQDCIFRHGEIYVMKRDGSDVQRITNTEVSECGATWWPDSKRLIYSVSCSLLHEPTEIYTIDLKGGHPAQMTDSSKVPVKQHYAYNLGPQPSPDGRNILFYSFRDDDREMYLMNPDGSGQVRLTNMAGLELGATWSPDSSSITWEHEGEILVIDVKTREIVPTGTRELSACQPHWLPSGQKIVFVANCGFGGNGPHDFIYIMNRDGSDKVRLAAQLNRKQLGIIAWVPSEWMKIGTPFN